jgi:hypothetical protein
MSALVKALKPAVPVMRRLVGSDESMNVMEPTGSIVYLSDWEENGREWEREWKRVRKRVRKRMEESEEENGREWGREGKRVRKRREESEEEKGREWGREGKRVRKRREESEEEKGRERGRTEDSEWSDDELGRGVQMSVFLVFLVKIVKNQTQNQIKGNKWNVND